jgi:ubiquinone/menaquinone biosynthesis C-methylase UbiE
MGFYSKYILPSVINLACKQSSHTRQREKIIPLAQGNVLEIGVGPGLNLPIYDKAKIIKLTAIDPSEDIWKKGNIDVNKLPYAFEYLPASAEALPFPDQTFDTVVVTYSLCTIPNPEKALQEMRRVLKKDGKLLFCEHGLAPDKNVRVVQNIVNPIWKQFGGGCNLHRNIPEIIRKSGFKIQSLDNMYIPGWKPATYNYWGIATAC